MDRRYLRLAVALLATGLLVAGEWRAKGQNTGDREPADAQAVSSGPAAGELEPVEVPQPSEKALRYYHSGMRIWAFNVFWALLVPAVIAFSGLSARLRNLAQRIGRWWFFTVGLYVILYLGLVFLIDLPLDYFEGFVRQHAYGLSNQTFAKWLGDAFLELGVGMAAGFAFAWIPYLLLARAPRRWWLYTAALSVPFLFMTVMIKPIWIDPLFNDFGPMKNKAIERSILDLAQRAGIENSRVFEVDKSVDTKAVNAYVTGVLGTKRIVLWDTLISRLGEKELLFVMAHEMGHYVLGHVVRSILLSALVTLIGLYLVDRIGRWIISRYAHLLRFSESIRHCVRSLAPGAAPAQQPVPGSGRDVRTAATQEHEADHFALDLTHDQSLRSHSLRQAPRGESGQSSPRMGLQGLPRLSPKHW